MIQAIMNPKTRILQHYQPRWIDPKTAIAVSGAKKSDLAVPAGTNGLFELPAGRTEYCHIKGGVDVVVQGGTSTAQLRVDGTTGDICIQDTTIDIRGKEPSDCIDVTPTKPGDVCLQRLKLYGADGNFNTVHPDLFQAQGNIEFLYLADVEGWYMYQGIFIKGVEGHTCSGIYADRVRLYDLGGKGKGWWFTDAGNIPVWLNDCWLQPFPGRPLEDCIHPKPLISADGLTAYYPPDSPIKGVIRKIV